MWFEPYKYDVKELINSIIRQQSFNVDEFQLVNIAFYGSRTNGRGNNESDLDVLLEYKGTAREDAIFDVLAKQEFLLEGVSLDINPIKEEKSGTISEYFERCDDNWKR